jgi:chemotaxis protein MotB
MQRYAICLVIVAAAACGPKPPPQDPRVAQLEKELDDTKAVLKKERDEGDALRNADAELKAKADEAKALEDKLAEAVGKAGEVTTADGAVRLELVDQILFPLGEAELTQNGKDVLAKVGAALKDVEDKQIWVQGHTDDTPIVVKEPKAEPVPPPAPGKGKAKPGAKAAKEPPKPAKEPPRPAEPAKAKNDAVLAFVTNWELSAARALTVVHYLQDDAKIDPTRLAAVAFGQYRPVSKVKAKNRRIEIVLYPRAKLSPK